MGAIKNHGQQKHPRRSSEKIMTSRTLTLLVLAGGIGELYAYKPHAAESIIVALTVLAMLAKLVS